MAIMSLLAHLMLCRSTSTTPMLRMPLIAAITGEVTYMPPKAVTSSAAPRQQGKKPRTVTTAIATTEKTGRPDSVRLGMKMS